MKSWVVTGASRGIGRAIAERACSLGDRVAVFARSDPGELKKQLSDDSLVLTVDVTDHDSVRWGMQEVAAAYGGIDVLVNNAGIHAGGRLERLAVGDWERVVATNLTGPLLVTQAALPHMGAGAAIVNIGAVVGLRGFPGDAPYGASKAGLAGLTAVLAVELAARGIRVNLVVPGFVETDMTAELSARARDAIRQRIPLGRTGTPEEIADVVTWVAGATYMTGSVVATDGGLLAAMGGA